MKHFITICLMFVSINAASAQTNTYPSDLIVAQDGSGQYKTIQEAVNAVRDLSQQRVTIYIKSGTYHEKLAIPSWKSRITLLGDDPVNTIITNADYSGKPYPGGKDAYGKDKFSTYTSYTVLVQGNDVNIENLTIENASGRVGQAVALHVEGDRFRIGNCRLLGNQDTVYTATWESRQYYQNCYIEGTTDFIFGEATAVFQDCTLKSLSNSFITAAATTPHQNTGYVFFNCKLIAAEGVDKVFLGRPWRPNARVEFINCEMGAHIVPQGWNNWGNPENEKTVNYAEYGSRGLGSDTTMRAKWAKRLTPLSVKLLNPDLIFHTIDQWNPEKP